MTYYSSNQAENYWCELNAKTLLGAKRECNKDYDSASEIEIAYIDETLSEECRQYEMVAYRSAHTKSWIEV